MTRNESWRIHHYHEIFINIFFIFQHWPLSTNNAYHCAYIHITVSPIWQSAILMLLERKEPSWNTAASWSIPGIGWAVEKLKDDHFPRQIWMNQETRCCFFCGVFWTDFWCVFSKNWCFCFDSKKMIWGFFQGWMADEIIQTLLCLDLLSNQDRRLSLAYSTQSDALAGCQELLRFQFYVIMWATYSRFLLVRESFFKRPLVATLGSTLSSM